MRYFHVIVISLTMLLATGCGFKLQDTTQVPTELQTMVLDSSDPYGALTRTVRTQLRLNNVTIVNNPGTRTDIPSLKLLGESTERDTASVFQNGIAAEYSLAMVVRAQVQLPGKGIYPISATVYRSFFDNPQRALAKDAEQEMIRQEMREKASQQLIRKLSSIQPELKQLNAATTDTRIKMRSDRISPASPSSGHDTGQ